ncbi:MAG: replicative DNA helicase [Clostridia bacterium]|nr:replicative DNA helicase [Clostridia bacterium]
MEEEKVSISKIPPNDLVAEQAVLGSMLVDTEAVIKAIELLQPEDFYREDNKEIYAAMLELYGRGKPIDFLTVKENLKLRGTLEKVGAEAYLSNLIDMVPTTSNIEAYAKIVEEKSVLRSLIKAANDVLAYGYAQSEEVDKIVEMTEKRIFDVLQKRNSKGYQSIKDVLVDSFEEIEQLYKSKSNVSGMESGFKDLDIKTSGINNSDLILVAARPAMGKSAFALNMATYVAKTQKVPVMIFSLEMSKKQMVNRILCSEAGVDSMKVRTGKLDSEDWVKLGKASGMLSEVPIYIDDTPGLSSAELRAKCRKAKLEKGIGMVVIDYLQLMESKGKTDSRQQEISEISRSLKILAKELNIPVIALSQLSRAPEQRNDHRPILSDLRESGSIEQDADIVMFLYRDDYYNPDTDKKNVAEVIIAKNRQGSTGTVELAWLGQYTRFANLYSG